MSAEAAFIGSRLWESWVSTRCCAEFTNPPELRAHALDVDSGRLFVSLNFCNQYFDINLAYCCIRLNLKDLRRQSAQRQMAVEGRASLGCLACPRSPRKGIEFGLSPGGADPV